MIHPLFVLTTDPDNINSSKYASRFGKRNFQRRIYSTCLLFVHFLYFKNGSIAFSRFDLKPFSGQKTLLMRVHSIVGNT